MTSVSNWDELIELVNSCKRSNYTDNIPRTIVLYASNNKDGVPVELFFSVVPCTSSRSVANICNLEIRDFMRT